MFGLVRDSTSGQQLQTQMSIALIVQGQPHLEDTRCVPIATEEVFRQFWLPASEELGLAWVPLFEGGLPITTADLPCVIADLELLRNHWRWSDSGARGHSERLLERLDPLLEELKSLLANVEVDAYIG